jgi:hypothetical protein
MKDNLAISRRYFLAAGYLTGGSLLVGGGYAA